MKYYPRFSAATQGRNDHETMRNEFTRLIAALNWNDNFAAGRANFVMATGIKVDYAETRSFGKRSYVVAQESAANSWSATPGAATGGVAIPAGNEASVAIGSGAGQLLLAVTFVPDPAGASTVGGDGTIPGVDIFFTDGVSDVHRPFSSPNGTSRTLTTGIPVDGFMAIHLTGGAAFSFSLGANTYGTAVGNSRLFFRTIGWDV